MTMKDIMKFEAMCKSCGWNWYSNEYMVQASYLEGEKKTVGVCPKCGEEKELYSGETWNKASTKNIHRPDKVL